MDQKQITVSLLKESILALSYYDPSDDFYNEKSVGIAVNGKPLLVLGPSDDAKSNSIADRLLKCTDFVDAVEYQYGQVILTKVVVSNADIGKHQMLGLHESKQGVMDSPNDLRVKGAVLEAIFVPDPKSISSLALHCCIQTNIMKCFHPEANRLSYTLELKESKAVSYS